MESGKFCIDEHVQHIERNVTTGEKNKTSNYCVIILFKLTIKFAYKFCLSFLLTLLIPFKS
jgi:hypothetical protein